MPKKRKDPSLRMQTSCNPAKRRKDEVAKGNTNVVPPASAGPSIEADHHHPHETHVSQREDADFSATANSIKLPGVDWSATAGTGHPGASSKSFLFVSNNRVQPDVGLVIYKKAKVDLEDKTIEYHISDFLVSNEVLSGQFDSIECLEQCLRRFNDIRFCEGIPDDRHCPLSGLNIPSASFSAGVWRSNRCVDTLVINS